MDWIIVIYAIINLICWAGVTRSIRQLKRQELRPDKTWSYAANSELQFLILQISDHIIALANQRALSRISPDDEPYVSTDDVVLAWDELRDSDFLRGKHKRRAKTTPEERSCVVCGNPRHPRCHRHDAP